MVSVARQPELGFGDEMLFRYLGRDGEPHGAFPVRVVEDRGDRIVVWLAPDTPIRYYATRLGGDPRELPIEVRFARPFGSIGRLWRGPGCIRVIPLEATYQVVLFWRDGGSFLGWYANLEAPKTVSWRPAGDGRAPQLRVDTVDWQLDLWIGADRVPRWKDEDEAEAAVASGYLTPGELATARATGDAIIARLDAWLDELGDWTGWIPPPGWTIPALRDDWAD